MNKITKKLPKHLHKFIVKQPYNEYTDQNQAVWKYVMRINLDFLSKVGHASYVKELQKTRISSAEDHDMHEAVSLLSILKENTNSSQKEINQAQEKVEYLQNNVSKLSEMAQIRNLHWWRLERGLIETVENIKIYGAGLLSSIG